MDAEGIRESLEAGGLRCTPQRYAVMAFLTEQNQHPTAAEIFEAVNRLDPRSSRATTYNNLRDLVEAGLVREVAVEGRAARFDATGLRHNHFICDRCGGVEDIEWTELPRPEAGAMGKRVLRECELIFRGLCAECAVGADDPSGSVAREDAAEDDGISGRRNLRNGGIQLGAMDDDRRKARSFNADDGADGPHAD